MVPGTTRSELSEADFARLHSKLISLYCGQGLSLDTARDLTQETFLQVCVSFESFASRSEFDTWVCGIGKKVWLKHLRSGSALKRDAPEVELDDAAEAEVCAVASPSPEELVVGQDLFDRVKISIRRLPASMRDSLVMYADGTKYKEIAVRLGITESRVASLIYQARAKLRRELS